MEETKKGCNKGEFIKYGKYNGDTETKTTYGIFDDEVYAHENLYNTI